MQLTLTNPLSTSSSFAAHKNQDMDLNFLNNISDKEELDQKIDLLYEKVLTEVSLINIKHEQTLVVLEKFIQQEELTEQLKKEYDLKSIEYQNNITTLKSELSDKTQELNNKIQELKNAHEHKEKEITQIKLEFEKNLEQTKQNYETTISNQKEENATLKKVIEVTNENYDQMKLTLEQVNKKVEVQEEEIISKTKELGLNKITRDILEQKLAIYENANNIEVITTGNKDLFTKPKLADSDDESEEDNVSLSKPTDKKMEKDKDDEEDLFYSEDNKNPLDLLSTNNYTNNINVELDNNNHVSCSGEDNFHSYSD